MKIICAPDKFKGSLTAMQAAQAMEIGIRRVCPGAQVDLCPVADGGEGTVDALVQACHGRRQRTVVTGPLFAPVTAEWGLLEGPPRTAVIEMAAASGLGLVPPARRDPTRTTTFGTGELIWAAMHEGVRRIILGIGGSATCDGGCGVAAASAVLFLDATGRTGPLRIPTGGTLRDIARLEAMGLGEELASVEILVACDVRNPLTGPEGAARVYAPQKGATPAQVELLEQGLKHLAELWRHDLGVDVEALAGAGAAGGLGGGMVAFFGARLAPGIQLVLQAADFRRRVAGCDLCLTGEGCLDSQTAAGKVCLGVAQAARQAGVPTVALAGSLGPGAEATLAAGLTEYHAIAPAGATKEDSMAWAAEYLQAATAAVVAARMGPSACGGAAENVEAG